MVIKVKKFRVLKLSLCIVIFLAETQHLAFSEVSFNPQLLEGIDAESFKSDLSNFEKGSQLPGTYYVDIVIDNKTVESRNVTFTSGTDNKLMPCLSVVQLKQWGVKTDNYPDLQSGNEECANLSAIPDATTEFQFNNQRLIVSIPQVALEQQTRGLVPPELWDNGITAGSLNYSLYGSTVKNSSSGEMVNTQFANLRPGLNIGPWRIRNYTTFNRDDNGVTQWNNVYNYVQRPIVPLKSELTLGDSSSFSDVFDSIPFRGAQIASDEDMIPDSLRGYAPVVRGVARTNAQVIIRQNGYEIYKNAVTPGAFEINDLYNTGGAGDLNVTIKEADGSEQNFTVAFASLPVLQREKSFKYTITGGQYRSYNSQVKKTPFGQVTGVYGLPYGFTVFGGVQHSDIYRSVATGLGKNLGSFGAVSVDLTQAVSDLPGQDKLTGQSWRARYSKNFAETGTNFAIAGYRYSTREYYGMQEVFDTYSLMDKYQEKRRNRAELTMNQRLGETLGSLSISTIREDYWMSGKTMQSTSLGYSNSWGMASYGLTYTRSKNGLATSFGNVSRYDKNEMLALNISVPFDAVMPRSRLNYSGSTDKNSSATHIVGLSGTALTDDTLNWSVQQGYSGQNVGYNGSVNASYKATYSDLTAGYAYDQRAKRLNYGLQGGVIAHADGITFTQTLGETNALIKAPGAKNVGIENQTGAKTDWRGYTAINSVQPYRNNSIGLKTDTFPEDVEFDLTSATVVPTRGAIVRAEYHPDIGKRALVTLKQSTGGPVPFGAIVTADGENNKSFVVGDSGQVFLTGMPETAVLHARWGESTTQRCQAAYREAGHASTGIIMLDLICNG